MLFQEANGGGLGKASVRYGLRWGRSPKRTNREQGKTTDLIRR
jgi:hypothetical protein